MAAPQQPPLPDWSVFSDLWRAVGEAARAAPWYARPSTATWDNVKIDVLAGDGVVVLRMAHDGPPPLLAEVRLSAEDAVDLSRRLERFATAASGGAGAATSKKGK